MHIPKRAYGLLLMLWAAGFRIDTEPSITSDPRYRRAHGEPTVTADPCRPIGKRIFTTESHVREVLIGLMGFRMPQAEP